MIQHEKAATKKRNDLQVLRACAIGSVLAFHYFPSLFVNGFLGVDIFFVLSGFLMFSILGQVASIRCNSLVDFYFRRFKRIIPLYTLVICVSTFISVPFLFTEEFEYVIEELKWAMPFFTNMRNFFQGGDYYEEISAYSLFLHTWSLGVELQYYVLVPLVVIAYRAIPRVYTMSWLLCLMGGSWLFSVATRPEVSFGFLLCRVWQFLVGSSVYDIQRREDQHRLPPPSKAPRKHANLIFALLLFLVFFPVEVNKDCLRLIVTLISGAVIASGPSFDDSSSSTRLLVYIGDLSYLIYLIHWPVLVLYKAHSDVDVLPLSGVLICLLLTVVLSSLLHPTLEGHFPRASLLSSIFFSVFWYALVFRLLQTEGWRGWTRVVEVPSAAFPGIDVPSAIRWNDEQIRKYDYIDYGLSKDVEAERWTSYHYDSRTEGIMKGNGSVNVLMIGNSYGYKAFDAILRIFNGRFRQFRLFLRFGTNVLSQTSNEHYTEALRTIVQNMQPDITFFTAREWPLIDTPLSLPVEDDAVFKHVKEQVDHIAGYSGVFVLEYQYFQPNRRPGIAYEIRDRLRRGKSDLHSLRVPFEEYERQSRGMAARLDALTAPNIIRNRVGDQLCQEQRDFCYLYNTDNLHAYYRDTCGHLTPDGIARLVPRWTEIIEQLLQNKTLKGRK